MSKNQNTETENENQEINEENFFLRLLKRIFSLI